MLQPREKQHILMRNISGHERDSSVKKTRGGYLCVILIYIFLNAWMPFINMVNISNLSRVLVLFNNVLFSLEFSSNIKLSVIDL